MKNGSVKQLITHFDGQLYNLCYKIVDESEDLQRDFQYICENLKKSPEEKTIKIDEYISEEEHELTLKIYNEKIEGILSEVINKVNYGIISPSNFYLELYNKLIENFKDKKQLSIAFERIIRDSRIPFVYLGRPLSMSGDDFKKCLEKNRDNINKIFYILKSGYSQKTEEASVLFNFIDSIKDYNDKVVVFASLIDILKNGGIANILKDILLRQQRDDDK